MAGDTGRGRIRADLICLSLTSGSRDQKNSLQRAATTHNT